MLVRVEAHAYGPRLYIFGRRRHHWEIGVALILAGAALVLHDRRDLPHHR